VFLPKVHRGASSRDLRAFLPTTREEMDARGWDSSTSCLINGDAYVDHPAFGGALIGRFLEGRGLSRRHDQPARWDGPEELRASAARASSSASPPATSTRCSTS
jgi:hypothetical protein